MMKRAILIIIPSIFFAGCEKPLEKAIHGVSGHIQDTVTESMGNGKHADHVRRSQLNVIKKGVDDLKKMRDPNISEVYKLIDKHLADDKLTGFEANEINSLISKHKMAINKQNSKHYDDVTAFKDAIRQ